MTMLPREQQNHKTTINRISVKLLLEKQFLKQINQKRRININQLNITIMKETTRHINLIIHILEELQEQIEYHSAKRDYAVFQNKRRYIEEAQAYFNEIQRLEGEKLRHHPSSETGKSCSGMIEKKKGIINQLRKDFDFE